MHWFWCRGTMELHGRLKDYKLFSYKIIFKTYSVKSSKCSGAGGDTFNNVWITKMKWEKPPQNCWEQPLNTDREGAIRLIYLQTLNPGKSQK